MTEIAFWECLYVPGHDAACLSRRDTEGYRLHGTAVFRHEVGPARVNYSVDLDSEWRSQGGIIQGYLAARPLHHVIARNAEGWHLDGRHIAGLDHLIDLDFGFTPATNMQQLRRAALRPGEAAELPAAWFDLGMTTLQDLPQRYERLDETRYRYSSPTAGYEGVLEIAPNGFARVYPSLWRMLDA